MAAGQDATARGLHGESPMVMVLNRANYPTIHQLVETIRRLLANNHAVAVVPVDGSKYNWDRDSLSLLFSGQKGNLNTRVEWQSKPVALIL